MARDTLTGSRIRERRTALSMRQAELARRAGISASYLNLIEHNRRRIGGKLLVDIATVLGVEPAVLTEGAGAALMAVLREAALALPASGAERDRADEFAGRFPGWAQLVSDSHNRIAALERQVQALTDRMTHDPHLAASLHEILSTVTAIRSSASILAEPGEIAPDWQARFHRNIDEDSARLAETSRGLVSYLEAEASGDVATSLGAPQEEVDALLEVHGHHRPELEAGTDGAELADRFGASLSAAAQALLRQWFVRCAQDARALPLQPFAQAVARIGPDPATLSDALGQDPARIMRRLAVLPEDAPGAGIGLAICDGSGVLTFRKPLPDFPMPRFGSACPLWPLYRALSRPWILHAAPLVQIGRSGADLRAEAIALPKGRTAVNTDPLFEAHMMLRSAPPDSGAAPQTVGLNCRICPRRDCAARREPSILGDAETAF